MAGRPIDPNCVIVIGQLPGLAREQIDLEVDGRPERHACGTFVPVTLRTPNVALAEALALRKDEFGTAGIRSVDVIGDALAPGTIAAAVYSGAEYARGLGVAAPLHAFRRERTLL